MRASLRLVILAAALLATYGLTRAAAPVAPSAPADVRAVPMTLAAWRGVDAPPLSPDVMETLAADAYVRRWYRQDRARAVEMDISYYAQPRVGATMHSPLNCLPGNGWQITRMETVSLPGRSDAQVRALTVGRGTTQIAMAYWFQSGDRIVTGEGMTRFHLLRDALRRRPTDAGLVRVMAPLTPSTSAEQIVLDFAARLVPELAKVFRRT